MPWKDASELQPGDFILRYDDRAAINLYKGTVKDVLTDAHETTIFYQGGTFHRTENDTRVEIR